jgi:hypothetical protein
MIGREPST